MPRKSVRRKLFFWTWTFESPFGSHPEFDIDMASSNFSYTTGGDITLLHKRKIGGGGFGQVHEVLPPIPPHNFAYRLVALQHSHWKGLPLGKAETHDMTGICEKVALYPLDH